MRALPTLEPQPRAVARPPGRARVYRAHEDLLALLEVGGEHFGEAAVGDAEPHRDGHGLGVRPEDDDASRDGLAARPRVGHVLIIPGTLLGRQDAPDLLAGGFANPLALDPALVVVGAARAQRANLLACVLEDRIELLLLLGSEAQGLGETLSYLVDRGLARPSAGPRARGHASHGHAVVAGQAESQRGVRHLQNGVLLVHGEAHVGRHAGQELVIRIPRGDDDVVGDDVLDYLGRLADL